ncbi:BTAD domain-containing putative transcriptional regulator [Pseudonocardia sp. DLS-67]
MISALRIGVLGPLQVNDGDGPPIAVGGPRPRALLVLLALQPGRTVPVEQLVDGQYGEDPPADAVGAVQAQVARLRRALPAGVLAFEGGGYRLVVDPADVDATAFERLAEQGRVLLAAGDPKGAAAALRSGLALWRGPALTDLPHGGAAAARLTELRLTAVEDAAEAELALQAPTTDLVAQLRAMVAAHPLRERLRGLLMRALVAAGRPGEALTEFAQVRRLLADELGTDPSPELAGVHAAVLRAERPATRPHRPPAPLTSIVGRATELARLRAVADARLVTIVGPGGVGKTRLALEAAPDAPVVDLADVGADGPAAVATAVLAGLGVREAGLGMGPVADPGQRLAAALADVPRLVLDNCEHLTAAVAPLVRQVLAGCPDLAVLTTSREPLGITGEVLVPLDPLPADAAQRLFAERAAAVRPGAEVDGHAAAICAALDGLPLAIELAAARLRQFPVAELARRLAGDDRFTLLSRGDRTAAARHRTLRAAVEWSWDLLRPDEQALARRFAVFRGGARGDAVAQVCGVEEPDDLLADLVDRSVLVADPDADGARYRMLETIRAFCAERLTASGEDGPVHRAHARWALRYARDTDPLLRRAEQLAAQRRLAVEDANLGAALDWSVGHDPGTAFELVAALSAYWWLSGRRVRPGAAAAALLEREPPPGLDEEYVGVVVYALPRAAPARWRRAARIMRERDRPLRHPFTAAIWGMAAGPWAADGADPRSVLGGDGWSTALAGLSDGLMQVLHGEPAAGEAGLRDVLARFRELGERWGTAQALDGLAQVASWRGHWDRADEQWSAALTAMTELGALEECADLLCRRAHNALGREDLATAAAHTRAAQERWTEAGRPGRGPASALLAGAEVAHRCGDDEKARVLLEAAVEAARDGDFGSAGVRARALAALARLTANDDAAAELRRTAIAAVRDSPLRSDLAEAAECGAEAALRAGEPQRAALLLGAAVALRGTTVAGRTGAADVAGAARDELGAEAFAAQFARGVALDPAAAAATVDG